MSGRSMSGGAEVLHEARGAAFWITINRPDRRNAINRAVVEGIRAGLARAHEDPGIRAVVLTGAGDKAFCAGGDLAPGEGFVFDHARPNAAYADLLSTVIEEKNFRRIATRYDKLARNFLSAVALATLVAFWV
mgnify:CR=1 FL=1